MTIFTIDTDSEQKFLKSDNVSKVCLERLKDLIKDTDIEFKIFTPKDEIVDECLKKYSNYVKHIKGEVPVGYEPFLADLIRIYILSKNKNYLYIDSDIYFKNLDILKYLKEEPKAFFPYSFCGLWSGEHPETFQVVLDRFYKDVNDNGYQYIVGLDEAGRGPMAGELVVAGVIFPKGYYDERIYFNINSSDC